VTKPATLPFNEQGYFDSSLAQIAPLSVKVQGQSVAPLVKLPGDADVPILKLRFLPSSHQVTISSITVHQTGTMETSPTNSGYYSGMGDGDFSRLKLSFCAGEFIKYIVALVYFG
jgi:hypothetical protein